MQDFSLLELENTLHFPDEETVTIALASGDKMAWAAASPSAFLHVCLTCRVSDDMRLMSPREVSDMTAGDVLQKYLEYLEGI